MTGSNTDAAIRRFVERIERLEQEKREIAAAIADIYKDAKAEILNVKALRELIRERRMDATKRAALAETLDQYTHALGDLAGTPPGEAAASDFGQRVEAAARERFAAAGYVPDGPNKMRRDSDGTSIEFGKPVT